MHKQTQETVDKLRKVITNTIHSTLELGLSQRAMSDKDISFKCDCILAEILFIIGEE